MVAALDGNFDVVVLGGGNATLTAAISAARAGRRVVVLEGAPKFYRGENTRHTRNVSGVHLGLVLGLVLSLPYGKFVQGLYRFLALVKYAGERRRAAFVE